MSPTALKKYQMDIKKKKKKKKGKLMKKPFEKEK